MSHLVPHDQGQFIVIEAKTYQPLGQDDFPRGRIGVDRAILGFYQDGVFGRQALGIKGNRELLPFSV